MKQSFRAIRIKSRDEFEWLIEHLTHEAFRVRNHWDFWTALDKSFDEYSVELNQTPNFWELTRRAHKDAVILRLGRLFDPHPTAISLGNLLQTMKENAIAPSTPLPPAVANLDLSELDQEMSSVSDCEAPVKKLLTLRNEYLAHRGSRHVARGTFTSLPVLERDEIAARLKRRTLRPSAEPRAGHPSKVQRASGIPTATLEELRNAGFRGALSATAGGAPVAPEAEDASSPRAVDNRQLSGWLATRSET